MTKKIDAQRRMMIWRRKKITEGFTEKEYNQFEKDVFNGFISEDIAQMLNETKEVLSNIESNRKQSQKYFLYTVTVAIIGITISAVGMIVSLVL